MERPSEGERKRVMTRNNQSKGIPPSFLSSLYQMRKGDERR
jgi:hypothetical protein